VATGRDQHVHRDLAEIRRERLPDPRPPTVREAIGTFLDNVPRWMDAFERFLHRSRRWSRDPTWRYLLDQVGGMTGLWVVFALELGSRTDQQTADDTVATISEDGYTDPVLVAMLKTEIENSGLAWSRRQQLQAGLDHAVAGEHHLAVPLMLNALEGAFWRTAEQEGLVVQNQKGKWVRTEKAGKPGRLANGIETIFWLKGMNLTESFQRFLVGLVYGRSGDPFRHGSAEEGWRLRSLCLIASLIGWLELKGQIDGRREVIEAFSRVRESRRTAREGEAAPPVFQSPN
jgi:hypothetical protein